MTGRGPVRAAAFLGYLVLALGYTWPVARVLTTRFPGTDYENFGGVWNPWHFRYAVSVLHDHPLWTDMQYWPYGSNLLLGHYTLINDVVAYVLSPVIGLPACVNLLFLLSLALAGWGLFLFLMDWGVGAAAAFAAGTFFAFSPVMSLQTMTGRGAEYTSLHTLVFFAWFLFRVLRDGKLKDAVLAALFLTLTWFYNYYYFLSCLLLVPLAYIGWHRPIRLIVKERQESTALSALRAMCLTLAAGAGVLAGRALLTGQEQWHGRGSVREILLSLSPYLAFWGFLGLYLLLRLRPALRLEREAWKPRAWAGPAAVVACWLAMSWPLVWATLTFMRSGDYGAPVNRWRGGGNPVDLAWLLLPQYWQPLWRGALARWFGPAHYSFFGLGPLAALVWLWRKRPAAPEARAWGVCFAAFALLMLGPWLKVLGAHLYLPLPFYFLHALPVFINMPDGIIFGIPASLFAALLLGCALREAQRRAPGRWAPWVPWLALAALGFELWPGGIKTFRPEFPALIERLRDRPDGAMLPVPVSVNFHIIINPGPLGDAFMNHELAQTVHQKPYIGGHLGRVARRLYTVMSADPVFSGLLSAQQGGEIPAVLRDRSRVRRYLRDNRLRYLLVEAGRLPPALLKTLEAWPVRLIDRDGNLRLYEVSLVQSRAHG